MPHEERATGGRNGVGVGVAYVCVDPSEGTVVNWVLYAAAVLRCLAKGPSQDDARCSDSNQ
jgi:hypothetical protein